MEDALGKVMRKKLFESLQSNRQDITENCSDTNKKRE